MLVLHLLHVSLSILAAVLRSDRALARGAETPSTEVDTKSAQHLQLHKRGGMGPFKGLCPKSRAWDGRYCVDSTSVPGLYADACIRTRVRDQWGRYETPRISESFFGGSCPQMHWCKQIAPWAHHTIDLSHGVLPVEVDGGFKLPPSPDKPTIVCMRVQTIEDDDDRHQTPAGQTAADESDNIHLKHLSILAGPRTREALCVDAVRCAVQRESIETPVHPEIEAAAAAFRFDGVLETATIAALETGILYKQRCEIDLMWQHQAWQYQAEYANILAWETFIATGSQKLEAKTEPRPLDEHIQTRPTKKARTVKVERDKGKQIVVEEFEPKRSAFARWSASAESIASCNDPSSSTGPSCGSHCPPGPLIDQSAQQPKAEPDMFTLEMDLPYIPQEDLLAYLATFDDEWPHPDDVF